MVSKKWSEQARTVQKMKRVKDGKEVVSSVEFLSVCDDGIALYRDTFLKSGHYESLGMLAYQFIVVAGRECPDGGKFYELEYQVGDGFVYRALIQAVNPVTDIPMVLGAMERYGIISEEFYPRKARVTSYNEVHIGSCDINEESGEAEVHGAVYDSDGAGDLSIKDYVNGVHNDCCDFMNEACMMYFCDEPREFWVRKTDAYEDVFVCGSENVKWDCFEDKREADMWELNDLLTDAIGILEDYCIPHSIVVKNDFVEDNWTVHSTNQDDDIYSVLKAIIEAKDL